MIVQRQMCRDIVVHTYRVSTDRSPEKVWCWLATFSVELVNHCYGVEEYFQRRRKTDVSER